MDQQREGALRLEEALTVDPGASALHTDLALIYAQQGDRARARQHREQAGDQEPRLRDPVLEEVQTLRQDWAQYQVLGQLSLEAQKDDAAVEAFRRSLELGGDRVQIYVGLGQALERLGNQIGALEQYRSAVIVDPGSALAHQRLGSLMARLEGLEGDAIGHLQKAVELDSERAETQLLLADVLVAKGRLNEALDHFAAVARLDPQSEGTWLRGSRTLLQLGRYQEALQVLTEARSALPHSLAIADALARMLAACPDPALREGEEALSLSVWAFGVDPSSRYAEAVAMALAELGRCLEAAEWQRRALSLVGAEAAPAHRHRLLQKAERYQSVHPCRWDSLADEAGVADDH
jgi:tetratricopeptide (TPR) repeat protein